jgi:uncharacterized membrane protein
MTKGRLEAFSDGVFGVAITLLILDVQPEGGSTGWEILSHQWHHILIYVLSFVIVGVYWVAHHHMMHFITAANRTLLWINLLLLLFIVFVPFVAALLSASHADPSSIRIYASNLILINLTGTMLWWYVTKNHRLVNSAVPEAFIRFVLYLHTAAVLVYGVAIALASWYSYASLVLLAIAPAFFILPNPWLEKRIRHAMEVTHARGEKHEEPE